MPKVTPEFTETTVGTAARETYSARADRLGLSEEGLAIYDVMTTRINRLEKKLMRYLYDGPLMTCSSAVFDICSGASEAGSDNNLVIMSRTPGLWTRDINIEFKIAGLSTPLSIDVTSSSKTIVINLETDGAGAGISKLSRVMGAINSHPLAKSLVRAQALPGVTASTAVCDTAVAATYLTGGEYKVAVRVKN